MGSRITPLVVAFVFFSIVSLQAEAATKVCEIQDYDPHTGFSPLAGEEVTVKGVVTCPPGIFQKFYTSLFIRGIGDDECGVNVFCYDRIEGITIGDTVIVTGEVVEYVSRTGKGATTEIKLSSPRDLSVIPGLGVAEPDSMATGLAGSEWNEGKLVRVSGRLVSPVVGTSFIVDDGSGGIEVYDRGENFVGDSTWLNLRYGDEVTVTGIVSQSDPDMPYLSGYSILPRSPAFGDVAPKRCIPGGSSRAVLKVSEKIFAPDAGEKVTITYNGPHHGRISLRIFDAYGRCVATLDDRVSMCGEARVVWDGRDEVSRQLPVGLYLIVVTAHDPQTGSESKQTVPIVIGRRLK